MSINKVMISGNLTRDRDLRTTPSGTSVASFSVAVNDRRKNVQTGQWEDHPNYVDCTMFGTRAEGLAPYLVRGTKVAIDGHLQWRQWDDKESGKKRSKLDVIVDEIELMSGRDKPEPAPQQQAAPAYRQQQMPGMPTSQPVQPYDGDDDIPF